MGSQAWSSLPLFLLVVLMVSGGGAMAAPLRRPVPVPFGRNYVPTWAFDHIKYYNGGSQIELYLDKYTGTGFQSKGNYLFGHFSMDIKLVPGDSAGVVAAFYLSSQNSEHDEIDFEFLGNRSGQPIILQTNVFTGGQGNREQRVYLWFDPTIAFHTYSVLWNMYQIVFFVDDVPIRVFKNCKDLGVRFPFYQPMKIYSSLWNADDWATRGGLEKTDWSKAPFVAAYRGFHIDGCEASVEAKFCATQGMRWWDQKEFQDLDSFQYQRLGWVRQKYTVYNYCTDRSRYPTMPPECTRDKDFLLKLKQERRRKQKQNLREDAAGHGPFRKKGYIPLTTYLRTYKVGDYVDIKVNGAVHKGMPHKFYYGRTGLVWSVTKRAIDVEINKQVGNRIIRKRIHVRRQKPRLVGRRSAPRGSRKVPSPSTTTPIPYDVVNDLKGGY